VNFAQQSASGGANLAPENRDDIKCRFPLVCAARAIQREMNVCHRVGARHFLDDYGNEIFRQMIATIQQAAFKQLLGAVHRKQVGASRYSKPHLATIRLNSKFSGRLSFRLWMNVRVVEAQFDFSPHSGQSVIAVSSAQTSLAARTTASR
jgi:hypothetical protein